MGVENAIRIPSTTMDIDHKLTIKKDDDKGRSADSKLGEDVYNAVLACSHIIFAATCPEVYIPSALVGCAAKLLSDHYGFTKVDDKTKTKWQKQSEHFGDASWLSQTLTAASDLAIFKVAFTFHIAYPFIAFKGGMMGADLTTRAVKLINSFSSNKI